ncbi:hypothetical protein Tco_1294905 [Tanacetum coccineum]
MDVKKSNEMVDKIDKVLKHKEQLRRLEEYVGGRPKTINPRTFVRPIAPRLWPDNTTIVNYSCRSRHAWVRTSTSLRLLRYGYCKNLKKMVKTGQSRTRERKSTQRAGRMLNKLLDDELTKEEFIGLYWLIYNKPELVDKLFEPLMPFSLIPLSRGSFDVIVGMDWLSKRKFVIVCHEKVVRIPLEGDEILRVHGERTQGVVKTLMNTKCRLLRRGAWSSFEVRVGITEEGEVVTYLRFIANFSKIVKPITSLTERDQKYEWGAERKEAFQTLKNDLCDASINQM